jgi:hypothetical protein
LKVHFGIDEFAFIDAIDALFFFDSLEEYETVTRIGCSISDNAALMVGYELASLSSHAPLEINLNLLEIMKEERPSEIVKAAVPVIESLLKSQKPKNETIDLLLEACRQHDNPWNGLAILECADESLENICDKIREDKNK